MVGFRACRNLCQNPPLTGKDELAGAICTEGNGTSTQAPAVEPLLKPLTGQVRH